MYWYHSITFGVCSVTRLFILFPQEYNITDPSLPNSWRGSYSASTRFLHQVLISVSGLRTRGLTTLRSFKWSLYLRSPPKTLYTPPLSPTRATCQPTHNTHTHITIGNTAVHRFTASLNPITGSLLHYTTQHVSTYCEVNIRNLYLNNDVSLFK